MVDRGTDETDGDDRTGLSRRRLLAASSAAMASGMAGCGGSSPSDGGGTTTDPTVVNTALETADNETETGTGTEPATTASQGELVEPVLHGQTAQIPNEYMWNPWHKQNSPELPWWFTMLLTKPLLTGEVRNVMMDSWEWNTEERKATVVLKDGFTWWNGNEYTAEDSVISRRFGRVMTPEGSKLEEVEQVDDRTFALHYKELQNPQIVLRTDLVVSAVLPHEAIEPFLEQFQEASSQKERDRLIQNELGEWDLTIQEGAFENGWGTGLYRPTSATTTELTAKKYEDHPFADRTNLETLRWRLCRQSACEQYLVNDKLDYGEGLTPEKNPRVPDNISMVAKYGLLNHVCVHMRKGKEENPHLNRRGVRRAVASAINSAKVANIAGGRGLDTQVGFPRSLWPRWLNGQQENYIDYKMGGDAELVKQWMNSENYTKQGGTWVDPEGNELPTWEMIAPSWWQKGGRAVAQQLNNQGFNVNFTVPQAFWSRRDNGEFDMDFNSHANQWPHPYRFFSTAYVFGIDMGTDGDIKSWLEQGLSESQTWGTTLKPEIPTEIGATDLSGETKQINVWELSKQIRQAQSFEEAQNAVKTLSWWWNFDVPQIDVRQPFEGYWADTQNFDFPEKNADIYKAYRGLWFAWTQGRVSGKTE